MSEADDMLVDQLQAQLAQAQRERDAAMARWPDIIASQERRILELETQVQQAQAALTRMRICLEYLKRGCYRHAGGDGYCDCDAIDAALQAGPGG